MWDLGERVIWSGREYEIVGIFREPTLVLEADDGSQQLVGQSRVQRAPQP